MSDRLIPQVGRRTWRLLGLQTINALGTGLTLPFVLIYLGEVRGIPLGVAGAILATDGVVAIAVAPLAGRVVDRVGGHTGFTVAVVVNGLATAAYAVVHTAPAGFVVAAALGLVSPFLWTSWSALLTEVAPADKLSAAFGVAYAISNLGIGAGGIVGGAIVGGRSSGSFELIFLLDGVSYVLLGGLLVGFGRATRREADATVSDGAGPAGVASDGSEPDVAAPPGPGYRILLRDRRLLAVTAVGGLVTLAATGQQTATFPLWSVRYGGVAPVVVGAAFTANTTTVVLLQLFVLRFFRRHRRTSAAAIACGCFGGCWLLALLAGTVPSPWNAVFVIAALAVFAVGETFLSPSLPAILNALATAGTRGRYNAVYGMVSQAGLAAAPILAGVSLQSRAHALFLYLLIAACLLAAFGSLRLRRLLPSDADYETATPEAAATADLVATDER